MSQDEKQKLEEFERRTRELLQESVAHIDGATRSRLTRARYAALREAAASPSRSPLWQRWLPAGAIAAAVLAVLIVVGQQGAPSLQANTAAPGDDIELLADADALALAQESEDDYDFYEWAVYAAQDGEHAEVGT
jgi:hypothetical protein